MSSSDPVPTGQPESGSPFAAYELLWRRIFDRVPADMGDALGAIDRLLVLLVAEFNRAIERRGTQRREAGDPEAENYLYMALKRRNGVSYVEFRRRQYKRGRYANYRADEYLRLPKKPGDAAYNKIIRAAPRWFGVSTAMALEYVMLYLEVRSQATFIREASGKLGAVTSRWQQANEDYGSPTWTPFSD